MSVTSLISAPRSETIRRFRLLDPDNGPNNLPDYAKRDADANTRRDLDGGRMQSVS